MSKTITEAKTELEHYSLLRFFHPTMPKAAVWYCYDDSDSWAKKRRWSPTENRELAYKFKRRDDARRAANGVCWKSITEDGYKWEVVEVQEVRVTTHTYIEETVATNANELIALAKMAGDLLEGDFDE